MRATFEHYFPGRRTEPVTRFIIQTAVLSDTWFYAARQAGKPRWTTRRSEAQEFYAEDEARRSTAVVPGFSEVVSA